jgi:hypothetical protein
MLGDVIAIKAAPVGVFHQPQALLEEISQIEPIAIDPIEYAELDRFYGRSVRDFVLRLLE